MKPILFNTEMVRAILDGKKTVTRRVVKQDIVNQFDCEADGTPIAFIQQSTGDHFKTTDPCRYQAGDILYVRETWCELCHVDENGITHYDMIKYFYKTDGNYQIDLYDDDGFYLDDQKMKWKPSIHMPKEAARMFLRVKEVRVERLQNMHMDDAINEGAWGNGQPHLPFSLLYMEHPNASCNAVASFAHIWDRTVNKANIDKYGWDANPWVWVISFERISKEEAI